jgi:hypothetical protein
MTAKRVALIGFQVVLAILVGLAIRELWLSRSGDDAAARQAPETLAVSARITPDVHTFGEPVTATVEVVADAGFIKPDTVRVETDFAPYELAGEPTVDREVINGVARVVFTYPLRCLREGCDAAAARGVAQLEPGFVRYRFVEGSGPGRHILDWPPFEVASRVSPGAVEQLRWRASDTVLPAVTTRIGPGGLAVVLLAIAAVLVGIAVWLARRLWRTEPEGVVEEEGAPRTPLERALDLVLADSSNGAASPDRRRALERLARELTNVGQDGLAGDARALAWAPGPATGDDVAGFAQRVTEVTGAGAAA